MSLSGLDAALSGLRVAQRQLDVISNNVSNVSTPGYTRKLLPQETQVLQGAGAGVRSSPIIRKVDLFLERDLWTQVSKTNFLDVQAKYMNQIQEFHGPPDQELSISAEIARLRDAFTQMVNAPDDNLLLQQAVGEAEITARKFNDFSKLLKQMRNDAQDQVRISVAKVNDLTAQIADLNKQIKSNTALGRTSAALEDSRDIAIKSLSEEIEVSFFTRGDGVLVVQTRQGQQLADENATPVFFNPTPLGDLSYYPDSAAGLYVGGDPIKVHAAADITGTDPGGKIGAYLEMRDSTLPQYQTQLDELAHKLALRFDAQGIRLFTDQNGVVPPDGAGAFTAEAIGSISGLTPGTLLNTLPGMANGNTVTLTAQGSLPITFTIGPASTVNNLLTALNGVSGVTASLNMTGQIEVTQTNVTPLTASLLFGGTANLMTAIGISETQAYVAAPVSYVGFASNIRVNAAIVNDNSLLRHSTLSGVTVQEGSSEFLRRVVEFTFGEFEFLEAQGNVDLRVSGLPDTLQNVFGLDPQARVVGKVDIATLSTGWDLNVAPDNPFLPISGPPLLDEFTLRFDEGGANDTGNIIIDLTTVAATYPVPPAITGADALVTYLNNDIIAALPPPLNTTITAQLNQFGQLVLEGQVDIGIGIGTMGDDGLEYLGLSAGTTVAESPYFDVQVGRDDIVRVSVDPGDTEVTLLAKLNAISGIVATIDPVTGFLNMRPGPEYGGDIRLIDGPIFSTGGVSAVQELFGSPNPVAGVDHPLYRQTNLGPGANLRTEIITATTLIDYSQKMVSTQTEDANFVDARMADEQSYRDLLERKFVDESGVNLDEELAQLIVVQTAFAASAKAVTTIQEMFDTLLNAF